jgi:N-acetyl-gamma-glutamylphosphate reductase
MLVKINSSRGCNTGLCAQYLLVARLDNLGKGASGAAVQNLELMLGM